MDLLHEAIKSLSQFYSRVLLQDAEEWICFHQTDYSESQQVWPHPKSQDKKQLIPKFI